MIYLRTDRRLDLRWCLALIAILSALGWYGLYGLGQHLARCCVPEAAWRALAPWVL